MIEKRPGSRFDPALAGEADQVVRRVHELNPAVAPIQRLLQNLVAG
jgi:hypothetical protein